MKQNKNKLYQVQINYRFMGEDTIHSMHVYVLDTSWIFTCIPHEWELDYFEFIAFTDITIMDNCCAVIKDNN